MKLFFVASILLSFIYLPAFGQITKGNWMLGGNADFSRISNTSPSTAFQKQTSLNISPAVGYFIYDKLAAGVRIAYDYQNSSSGISSNSFSRIDIGPYVRYYFLSTENRFNIFSEANYFLQLGKISGEQFGATNGYKFLAGPVIYLNNIVGIEFTIGYASQQAVNKDGYINTFRTGIGLQIHLEKQSE